MEGAGILTLIFLLITAPISMWAERARNFERLAPIEQNLQRAADSIALPVITVLVSVLLFGASASKDFVSRLVTNPASVGWPAIVPVGLLVYCLVRGLIGIRRATGVRDGLLAARAFCKLVAGVVALFVLWPGHFDLSAYYLSPSIALALLVPAAWCVITGSVRFLLLTVGGGNALRIVTRTINQNNAPLRPARRRWWQRW
jgi:hypothetical protein